MDRVFLDANVLFSAAYLESSKLRRLWELTGVELISSEYAVEEARRNLSFARPRQLDVLGGLVDQLALVASGAGGEPWPAAMELADKDRPILAAAIQSGATHLLTGDKTHFGQLFGQCVGNMLVLTPGEYLRLTGGCAPGRAAISIGEA